MAPAPTPLLITGAGGMLGRTLRQRWADLQPLAVARAELDIADAAACTAMLSRLKPAVVVNCAAMTAVDACEGESSRAYAANALGPANLAIACQRQGTRLVHISTDYVFPGDLARPYHEFDATGPRTIYGLSKLAGEEAVRRHCPDHLIARVAWLYGPGGPSFLHTMLRLAGQGGEPVRVVDDQQGNPTSTTAVADRLRLLIECGIAGTVHLSCEGETTWFSFAREIFRARGAQRQVAPCTTAQFPRPAPRPANSRLDKLALRLHGLPPMPAWHDALAAFLTEFPDG